MPPVTLATCAAFASGDEDAALLVTALRRVGVDASWQIWTDPAVDWSAALTVVRSTWDYTDRVEQFRRWARGVPRLANPADALEWSTDKHYLVDLSAAGVPVVPTVFLEPGSARAGQVPELGDAADLEYIVKPSVGAGSRGVGRFAAGDQMGVRAHVAALHRQGQTALVQPYLAGVDAAGESALLYFGGEFSHAISKAAMLPEAMVYSQHGPRLYAPERIRPHRASPEELDVGAAVIAVLCRRFGQDLLYARVDLLPGPDGPLLVELEVVEPSLFLGYSQGAAQRCASAIAAAL